MIDTTTRKRMLVTDDKAGPYIRLPFTQVDDVRRLLEDNKIYHYLEENILSFDGGPEIAIIDLGRNGDAKAVQAVLDGAIETEASHGIGR